MKKILLSLFLCTILFGYDIDVQKITQKIEKLKNFKISKRLNYKVYDPFATAKPILKKETIVRHIIARRAIVVETILNHKAFIDGSWHSSGGYIHGVKIIKVLHDGILVARGSKKVLIPLKKEKDIIKTKEYDK